MNFQVALLKLNVYFVDKRNTLNMESLFVKMNAKYAEGVRITQIKTVFLVIQGQL